MGLSFVPALHDAHVHLGFTAHPRNLADQAATKGSLLFCQTVEPSEFVRLSSLLAAAPNVRLGLGLHPWWVVSSDQGEGCARQLREFLELVPTTRFVGEVGLDASPRCAASAPDQLRVFQATLKACAHRPEAVLSVHCVGAADVLLDQLERTGLARQCAVVLHWFSGTSDQLTRARRLGCWFSVGCRMLQTKRGRAYVRAMPAQRLLLETDMPDAGCTDPPTELEYSCLRARLQRAQDQVDAARGGLWAQQIAQNTVGLLGPIR